MIKTLLTSKKLLLALAVLASLALTFSLIKSKISPPVLNSSLPPNAATKFSVISPLQLEFQNPILAADLSIQSSPEVAWQITQKDAITVTLMHQAPLLPATKYALNISWRGKFVSTLIFTTQDTQTDYVLLDKLKTELDRDYPLATLTPYITPQYTAAYSAPLTLEITLKNPNLTSAEVIEEVKSWVTQNGGNASSHKYVIASPSASPTP